MKKLCDMERHGERGALYQMDTVLEGDELMFYAQVWDEWGDENLENDRNRLVALVRRTAAKHGVNNERTIQKVIAFIEELDGLPS
jgi:hypothetical protein